jgi:hypothetical protein
MNMTASSEGPSLLLRASFQYVAAARVGCSQAFDSLKGPLETSIKALEYHAELLQ